MCTPRGPQEDVYGYGDFEGDWRGTPKGTLEATTNRTLKRTCFLAQAQVQFQVLRLQLKFNHLELDSEVGRLV